MQKKLQLNRFKLGNRSHLQGSYSTLLLLIGMIIFSTILSGGVFLQPENLLNLAYQNVILGLVALGQFLVILTSGIDLSIGSILGLSSVLVVLCHDFGPIVAVAIALSISILLGFVNGSLIAIRRLPAFVSTLAMNLIAYSFAQVVGGGAAVYNSFGGKEISTFILNFNKYYLLGIPYPVIVWLIVLIGVSFYIRTSYGHFSYSVGGNESAAFMSGVPVKVVKIWAYVLAAFLAGVGGVLFVARVGMGSPQAGTWYPLDSIAAVTIGGASLSGGVGSIIGTLMGVFILGILNNILNLLNVSPTLQPAVKGIVIILSVYLNSRRIKKD